MKRKENNNKQTQGAGVRAEAGNMASLWPRRDQGVKEEKEGKAGKSGKVSGRRRGKQEKVQERRKRWDGREERIKREARVSKVKRGEVGGT